MSAYAWRTSAWKPGALKTGSWGPLIALGTLSSTVGTVTLTGAAGLGIGGAFSATLADVTLTASGNAAFGLNLGDLSATVGNVTLAGAGSLHITGTLSATVGNVSLTGAAGLGIGGAFSATLDNVTLSAQGLPDAATGSLSVTFGDVFIDPPGPGGSGTVSGPPIAPIGGGGGGLRFATLDAAGNGGVTQNLSLVVYGVKRNT